MRRITLLLSVLFTLGCAEARYGQEGKSVFDAERDTNQCENTVLAEHEGLRHTTANERQRYLDDCMKAKGYRVK